MVSEGFSVPDLPFKMAASVPDLTWSWPRGTKNKNGQPRPQGLLLVQNGGSEKLLSKAAKWLQKFVWILSRKTRWNVIVLFEQRFQIARKQQGCQTLETTSEKAISLCVTWQKAPRFLEYFSSLGQGFLRPAILNEEKALGTRLQNGHLAKH